MTEQLRTPLRPRDQLPRVGPRRRPGRHPAARSHLRQQQLGAGRPADRRAVPLHRPGRARSRRQRLGRRLLLRGPARRRAGGDGRTWACSRRRSIGHSMGGLVGVPAGRQPSRPGPGPGAGGRAGLGPADPPREVPEGPQPGRADRLAGRPRRRNLAQQPGSGLGGLRRANRLPDPARGRGPQPPAAEATSASWPSGSPGAATSPWTPPTACTASGRASSPRSSSPSWTRPSAERLTLGVPRS